MDAKKVRVTIQKHGETFPSFAELDGFVYPTVGLAITPDITRLGFNVTHIGSGLTVNSIVQTKAQCEKFVRAERASGRVWNFKKDEARQWLNDNEEARENLRSMLCVRHSKVTARRRKEPLV